MRYMNKKWLNITMAVIIAILAGFLLTNDSFCAEKKEAGKTAMKMGHDMPLIGELCVTCHMETKTPYPKSISPKINNKHDGCNRCHLKDGTITGHCGCDETDDPMDCEQCHTTPATGTIPSAETMNNVCLDCH